MFNWNVEDMKLLNMDRVREDYTYDKAYACESEVSIEDKFEFVDRMQEGKLSYITNLVKAYQEAIPFMKKGDNGNPTEYAKRAWVRKNDIQGLIRRVTDSCGDYGDFDILHVRGNLFTFPNRPNCYRQLTEEEFISHLFHEQLEKCEQEERSYYFSQDETAQFLSKFDEKCYLLGINHLEDLHSFLLSVYPAKKPSDNNKVILSTYNKGKYREKQRKELSLEEVHQLDVAFSELIMKSAEMKAAIEKARQVYKEAEQAVVEKIKSMAE